MRSTVASKSIVPIAMASRSTFRAVSTSRRLLPSASTAYLSVRPYSLYSGRSSNDIVSVPRSRPVIIQAVRYLHHTPSVLELQKQDQQVQPPPPTSSSTSSSSRRPSTLTPPPQQPPSPSSPSPSAAARSPLSQQPHQKPQSSESTTNAPPPTPTTNATASATPSSPPVSANQTVTPPSPQKVITEKLKELWATAKYLFKFYYNGLKQIWHHRKQVAEIQNRVQSGGSALTRPESQLIRTHKSDMRKLPLFLTVLLILEEALPLVVIWAPSLLPSTCILPSQLTKIRVQEEINRASAYDRLKDMPQIQSLLPVVIVESTSSSSSSSLAPLHLNKNQNNSEKQVDDLFNQLDKQAIVQLAKLFSLSTWGGITFTRKRLFQHFSYLREDDRLMTMTTGRKDLMIPQNLETLTQACSERGLRATDISLFEMDKSLRLWLHHTTQNSSTNSMSNCSLSFLALQLYHPTCFETLQTCLDPQPNKGLIEKTKQVFKEVVEEEKKVRP